MAWWGKVCFARVFGPYTPAKADCSAGQCWGTWTWSHQTLWLWAVSPPKVGWERGLVEGRALPCLPGSHGMGQQPGTCQARQRGNGLQFAAMLQLPAMALSRDQLRQHPWPPEASLLSCRHPGLLLGQLIAASEGVAANPTLRGAMSWVQSGLNPPERGAGLCPWCCWPDLQADAAAWWNGAFSHARLCWRNVCFAVLVFGSLES